jgi:hypothetical protein
LEKVEQAIRHKKVHPIMLLMAYLESEALVLHIAQSRGESWIPGVIRRLRAGHSFDQALQDVISVPPERMLEQARQALN